ncbi:MAG: hypothetical protein MAG451_01244 [Anaerolineales bacterium]|nr:hypothetical protein [Anaerolineales bacterium]
MVFRPMSPHILRRYCIETRFLRQGLLELHHVIPYFLFGFSLFFCQSFFVYL